MEQPKVSGRVKNKKRLFIMVGIVLLLAIAAGVSAWMIVAKLSKPSNAYACSDETLKKVGQNLVDPIDSAALKKAADGIAATPGYEKNPNCVYVTTYYNLAYGSSSVAKTELAKLQKAFDPSVGYSPLIAKHALSPDDLADRIEGAQERLSTNIESTQVMSADGGGVPQ